MDDTFVRALIWGLTLSIIHILLITLITFTYDRHTASVVSYTLLIPLLFFGFWRGRKARRKGYIFSKKYL